MALSVSFHQALSLFVQHLKAANVEQHWIARYTRALQGPLRGMIARQLPPTVAAQTVDSLPISEIPPTVIQDCMRLSRNLNDRIARRFFKFLIYADLLDRRFLPIRKTVLRRAIEQAPEQLSPQMQLHQACCAYSKYLWEKKTLLYDAVRTQYHHLKAFAAWKGIHTRIGAITPEDIRDYLRWLKQQRRYSAVSRANTLSGLRAFFCLFTVSGILKTNPTTGLRVKKPKKQPPTALSEQELTGIFTTAYLDFRRYEELTPRTYKQALSRWLAARDWAIVSLLITTGIRSKEIARLQTDSIDFAQRLIKISGKGDSLHTVRERIVPLSEPLTLCALETYLRFRPESMFPHLFLSPRREPLQWTGFSTRIKDIARQAQISKAVTITELRRSFSSLCAHKGIDPLMLKQIMGHQSLATTMKYYLSIREQQLREVWENNNPLRYFSNKEWQGWIL
jgi:site-specific recombinase XerD